MSGGNDASLSFDDLVSLLTKMGYTAPHERQPYHLSARIELLNLQPSSGGKAKSYQVRQVREELKNRKLNP